MLSSCYFKHFMGVMEVTANLRLTEIVDEKLYQSPGDLQYTCTYTN